LGLEDEALKLRKEVFALSQRQPHLVSRQTDDAPLKATHLDGFDPSQPLRASSLIVHSMFQPPNSPQVRTIVHGSRQSDQRFSTPRESGYVALIEPVWWCCRAGEAAQVEAPVYRPPIPDLWRVPDALAHMRTLLAAQPGGGELRTFLPAIAADAPDRLSPQSRSARKANRAWDEQGPAGRFGKSITARRIVPVASRMIGFYA